MSAQNAALVSNGDIDNVDKPDGLVLFACVIAALEDAEIDECVRVDAEALENSHPKFLRGVLDAFLGERKLQLGYANHALF